jgi:cell division inhibitor SulA
MTSMNLRAVLLAVACATLATTFATVPAPAQSNFDDVQTLLAQIQTDKRAVVLKAMQLDDAQMATFTPVYDEYQAERKKLAENGIEIIDTYAANYDSMTDDAAGKLLKRWLGHQEDQQALTKKYVKRLDKVLPTTKVLRFVQIENKLNAVLSLPAVRGVPLAK